MRISITFGRPIRIGFASPALPIPEWHAERAPLPLPADDALRRFASLGENRLHKQVGL